MKNPCLFILALSIALQSYAQTDSFIVDGVYRNFIVHLPAGYSASTSYPLVLNLHGYTSNAGQEELYTQMDVSSDANHYIVIYPNGIANYWNSWGPPGATYGADDTKFLTALIDSMSARYNIDARRIYSCGISNGGYMTYTLACALAGRLAAIASVSGTMSNYTYANCNLARRIPVMHVHGTSDPVVPYGTGAASSIGAEQTVAFWRDTNACINATDTIFIPNTVTSDSSTVQEIRYQHCPAGNEVLFYKIINGGHTWPGGVIDIPSYGNTNHDISGTDEIWKFFSRYTLDGPATGISAATATPTPTVAVSPNPAGGEIIITTDKMVYGTIIYDLTGRQLTSFAETKMLDISNLTAGIYVASITTSDKEDIAVKFVKQ